jgi:hypothetical protein
VTFDNILRVMYVHSEVISPEVSLPHSGGVERAYRNQKSAYMFFPA